MGKGKYRFFFILLCAIAGIALGVGAGFAIAGLTHKVGLFLLSIGSVMCLVIFAIAVTLILLLGVYYHKVDVAEKMTVPYFAKSTKVKPLSGMTPYLRKRANCSLLLLSYYDPKEGEKGGLYAKAIINSKIESYFKDRNVFFIAPDQFAFFLVEEELPGYQELFASLNRKLKHDHPSLRILGGLSSNKIGKDYHVAYDEALEALFDRIPIREGASIVKYEDLPGLYKGIAGLHPIEMVYRSGEGKVIEAYPYGYGFAPNPLGFLGSLGLTEAYEEASLELAKQRIEESKNLVGIYFSPASLYVSSFYIRLSHFKNIKQLIVFLPAIELGKLDYVSKKLKRMGCHVGYYGIDSMTSLGRLDLEESYLILDEDFYEDDAAIVRAKKRLIASRNAAILGPHKGDDYIYVPGGENR